MSERVGHM